jgi:hypothetical protein
MRGPYRGGSTHFAVATCTPRYLGHDGAVISHASAAVLHQLPTWPEAIDRVHLTRNRSSGGNRRSIVQVHTAPLPMITSRGSMVCQ